MALDMQTQQKIEHFLSMIKEGSKNQNLVSQKTLGNLWDAHVIDCLQLAQMIPGGSTIADLGSGQGFPGIIIAIVAPTCQVNLVEVRKLRVKFLQKTVESLGLPNVTVHNSNSLKCKIGPQDVITTRGFGTVKYLLQNTYHMSDTHTTLLAIKSSFYEEILDLKPEITGTTMQGTVSGTGPIQIVSHISQEEYAVKYVSCKFKYNATPLSGNGCILQISDLEYHDMIE